MNSKDLSQEITGLRREIHKYAEVGFATKKTTTLIMKKLKEYGYEPEICGTCGIVAYCGKNKGKTILLRADMDALPIKEESQESFFATNGNMHACGHDMHTAMLLGAAKILKENEDNLSGQVKLMFQPAEEILEGAKDMVKAGVTNDVDAALMIHVMVNVPFETGTAVVATSETGAPAADFFEIEIYGRGCHGSSPNMGIDPITIAAHTILSLQQIKSRELSINTKSTLTIGTITAGNAKNVIPEKVVMGGTMRVFGEENRNFIKERVEEIVRGVANTFRGEARIQFTSGCPTLKIDDTLSERVSGYLKSLLGEEKVMFAKNLGMSKMTSGSEDFSYVSQKVPSLMIALAAGKTSEGYEYPLHHPKVKFDEKALMTGSLIYAQTAQKWLEEN